MFIFCFHLSQQIQSMPENHKNPFKQFCNKNSTNLLLEPLCNFKIKVKKIKQNNENY